MTVFFIWSRDSNTQRTSDPDIVYQLLLNYDSYKLKLDRMKRTLRYIVKPPDFDGSDFVI